MTGLVASRCAGPRVVMALREGFDPVSVVGSVAGLSDVAAVAEDMRVRLRFGLAERLACQNAEETRRYLADAAGDLGILVMVNGVVGGDTHRKLDPREFRGFAISDPMAPLVFVNGADTKAAQVFTLVHELAHIWAGDSALSDASMSTQSSHAKEIWANQVAAEVLIPEAEIARAYEGAASGGNHGKTQPWGLGRPFVRAVVADTLEGRTLYRDAYALLGTSRHATFEGLAREALVS
jgi:hypothetical protein